MVNTPDRSTCDPRDVYRDRSRGPRLQRILADAGIAARRSCETLIEQGRVEINGAIIDFLPAFADPAADRIAVDGVPIKRRTRRLYVMLNKPTRTISTSADEAAFDRRTVLDLVDHPAADRLFPVGRLDYDTTGLILLTNDGDLANKLTHPRFGVTKTYHAVVKGALTDEDASEIAQGIYLAERKAGKTLGASRTARVGVSVFKRDRDRTVLELQLTEGRNRQVRRMLAAVGCPVKKLERVAMGPLRLTGLPRGAWRELKRSEIETLRRAVRRGKHSQQPGPGPGPSRTRRSAAAKKRAPSGSANTATSTTQGGAIDPSRVRRAVVRTGFEGDRAERRPRRDRGDR